jgi:hypothetical protein
MPRNSIFEFHFLNYQFSQLIFAYLSFRFLIHSKFHEFLHFTYQLLLGDLVLKALILP